MGEWQSKILVVGDEEAIRDLVAEVLRREGFHVETAADGGEALTACYRQQPQVIVLDVSLAGESGFRLSRTVKSSVELFPSTRAPTILLMTGRRLDQEREYMLKAFCGADAVLYKPFENTVLVKQVRRLLAHQTPPEDAAHLMGSDWEAHDEVG